MSNFITLLIILYVAVAVVALILANWHVARQSAYTGRHRSGGRSTMETVAIAPVDPIVTHISVLATPLQGCALPPAPGARVYLELPTSTDRLTAARDSMRRRARALRAARWPSGELVVLPFSPFGTPITADEWAPERELVGAAT